MIRGVEGVVRLSALAFTASGEVLASTSIRYRACSPWTFMTNPELDCPRDASLGLEDNELTAEQLIAFYPPPAGFDAPPLEGEPQEACDLGETPIEVPVIAEAQVGDITLVTVKRVPVYLDERRRKNPELAPVQASRDEAGDYLFSLSVDEESLDYECRDERRQLEAVRVYVYATSGSFDASSTDIVPTPAGEVGPAEIQWTSEGESAILYFIAVDREGGVDWRSVFIDEADVN